MGSQTTEILTQMTIESQVFICMMEEKHIPQVAEIELASFASPWNESMLLNELQNPLSRYFVLLDKTNPSVVVAYGGYWKIFDEGHITNIAVKPDWRGRNAGTYLTGQMMQFAAAEGIESMTLEVRPSNETAIHVYEKLGFRREGLRKNYYEDNGEDALIMWYRKGESL